MSMGRDFSDAELDEIEGIANDKMEREKIVERSLVHREPLRVKQAIDPQAMAIVRDMFLEGNDVDAVAVLASELDLVVRDPVNYILGVSSEDRVAAGATRRITVTAPGAFRGFRFGCTIHTSQIFQIVSMVEIATSSRLINNVHAEAFGCWHSDGVKPGWIDPTSDHGVSGYKGPSLRFSRSMMYGAAYMFDVLNVTDVAAVFTGWITGEYQP